jgi:hypothetical protein
MLRMVRGEDKNVTLIGEPFHICRSQRMWVETCLTLPPPAQNPLTSRRFFSPDFPIWSSSRSLLTPHHRQISNRTYPGIASLANRLKLRATIYHSVTSPLQTIHHLANLRAVFAP